MITYDKLKEKFEDKGDLQGFYLIVPSPPLFIFNPVFLGTPKQQFDSYKEAVQSIYGEEWDYWNTYIDHQNYK